MTAIATTPWEVYAFAMKGMVPRGSLGEIGMVCIVQVEQLSEALKVFIARLEIANGRIQNWFAPCSLAVSETCCFFAPLTLNSI